MPDTLVAIKPRLSPELKRQKTIKTAASFSGIGIHTGEEVTIKFCPADEDVGIVFKRVDLPSKPLIPATVEYVQETSRNTTIGVGPVRIYTVEHVLAALAANDLDNVIIEVNGSEPPVGNGSSDVFLEMLEYSGIEEQSAYKPILKLNRPVFYSEGNVHLVALPSEDYCISYTLHYPGISAIGSQFYSLKVNSENFKKEIAHCRTFSLYSELKMLMDSGLIKGGSLENAVVVHDDAIFSKGGLKFPDEMVRHKILDLIGDLSLVGLPFRAHVIAICSGHATNVAFAKTLLNNITMENN